MAILSTVLLVFFVIVAILLILLVLLQDEEGDSMGGIFAGGSGSAFGSRSGNVLTRTTTVLGALFLIISLGVALLNRSPAGEGVEAAGRELSGEVAEPDWLEREINPQNFEESEVFDQEIVFDDELLTDNPEENITDNESAEIQEAE